MSLAARLVLGLPADPWRGVAVDTADARRVRAAAELAADGGMASVVGPRGAGKTHAIRVALAARTVVEPLRLDRHKLTLPDVLTAIVVQLSDERPRHSGEARTSQARRVLSGQRAVVLIDDAHLLHGHTVRGLRRLREIRWREPGPLCGVLFVGQRDRTANIAEVRLRTERVVLRGLAASEASEGLRLAYGGKLSDAAREEIAERWRNWLDVQDAAETALEAAVARGATRAETDDVPERRTVARQRPPTDADVQSAIAKRRAAA